MTSRPIPIEDIDTDGHTVAPGDDPVTDAGVAPVPEAARPNLKKPVETGMERQYDETTGPAGLVLLFGLLGLVWITGGFGYVAMILALLFIIFMHEMGHYATAKWSGMKVTEYFVGFGPRLWSFRRGETEYGIKGIPLGAYVRIVGMNNLEDVPPQDEPRTYRQQSFPKRLLVVSAGSLMHFFMALILLYVAIVGHGLNRDETQWGIAEVQSGGPAEMIGLQEGDRVLSANGTEFATFAEMADYVQVRPGEPVDLVVLRNDAEITLSGALGSVEGEADRGRIGVVFSPALLPLENVGPVDGIGETASEFADASWQSVRGLGEFFSPSGLADLGGRVFNPDPNQTDEEALNRPISVVGATKIGASLADEGWVGFVLLLASLNIFIGIFNLVPLLPLDGGHVSVAVYERIRSRKGRPYMADVSKLLPVAYATLAVLVFVGFATIYLDIADPISL